MSSTTAIEIKKNALSQAADAVAGTPPHSCKADCQPCHRADLQLLVVTPSVVPNEHANALKQAGYAWSPAFDAEFGSLKRVATTPVARIARAGFFFVYFPQRQRWDVWQIDEAGLTRKILNQVSIEQYANKYSAFIDPPQNFCSRGAANLPASLINVQGAGALAEVWVAYSARLWAPDVLRRLADNPEVPTGATGPDGKPVLAKIRTLLGRSLNPQAILQNGGAPAGCLPFNAAALEHNVADFVQQPDAAYLSAFGLAIRPLDGQRYGQGAQFEKLVRAIEKAGSPANNPQLYVGKSLIVMVPDPIGVAEQHNTIRLATLAARERWAAGGPTAKGYGADPNRPWERQSLLNAAYIREWVRDAEHQKQKRMFQHGAYRDTQVISGDEYRKILEHEKKTGRPYNPKGTTYERLKGDVERYRVTWPSTAVQQGLKDIAEADARKRIERYNSHIDWGRVEAANKKWKEEEKEWQDLTQARDTDHVAWLDSPLLAVALRHTHLDNSALRKAKLQRDQIEAHLIDAANRMEDTARCYAGGACSEASLKHMIVQFQKDPKDKSHWIAEALVGQYDFWDLVAGDDPDHGLRADLYTGAQGVRTAYEQAGQGIQLQLRGMRQHTELLNQAAQQALAKMHELAHDARKAQKLGLVDSVMQVRQKQVIWTNVMGLLHYIESGEKMLRINVVWKNHAFANAASDPLRNVPAFELKTNQHSERRRQSQKSAKSIGQAELRRAIENSDHPDKLTVPLILEQDVVEALAKRGHKIGPGMLQVAGGNLLGLPQAPLALPEDFARQVFQEQAKTRAELFKAWGETAAENYRGSLPSMAGHGFVFFLQWNAFCFALDEFGKAGGWAQVDAAASALSAAVGMFGVGLELGAILLSPRTLTKAGTPTAGVLVSQLPKAYLRLGLGAGWAGGAGALLDSVVNFAKSRGRWERGDKDAALLYLGSAAFHFAGFGAIFLGGWTSYRASALTQAGVRGMVKVLGIRFASSFAAAGVGSMLTGLGMFAWVTGVGIGIYAAMQEDDENEVFLERSYFGYGEDLGTLAKFASLEDEMLAFKTLARGFRAELEWQDNVTERDVVTVRLQTIEWDPKRYAVSFALDGYDKLDGELIGRIAEGEMADVQESGGIFEAVRRIPVDSEVEAVRLTFTLWNAKHRVANQPLLGNRGVTKIAEDRIWKKD